MKEHDARTSGKVQAVLWTQTQELRDREPGARIEAERGLVHGLGAEADAHLEELRVVADHGGAVDGGDAVLVLDVSVGDRIDEAPQMQVAKAVAKRAAQQEAAT